MIFFPLMNIPGLKPRRLPGIIGNGWSIILEWPTDGMAWFLFGWKLDSGKAYRLGPLTLTLYPKKRNYP